MNSERRYSQDSLEDNQRVLLGEMVRVGGEVMRFEDFDCKRR